MKKIILLSMAALFVLGLTQCNKKDIEDDIVSITLVLDTVPKGGAKADLQPNISGKVNYTEDDEILVVYDGKFVGTLNYSDGYFINDNMHIALNGEQPLYFYYLGNRQGDIEFGATGCTVSLSDQRDSYAIVSYAPSNEIFYGTDIYTAHLENQCGLVKFITPAIDEDVAISGLKNTIDIDFTDNSFTPYLNTYNDQIWLKTEEENTTVHWAILPIQGEVNNATAWADDYEESEAFTVPEVTRNMYYTEGVVVPQMQFLEPDLPGLFSVGGGTTVQFSRANLRWHYDVLMSNFGILNSYEGSFSFFRQQYNCLGNGMITLNGSFPITLPLYGPQYTVNGLVEGGGSSFKRHSLRDLYGWGTSGKISPDVVKQGDATPYANSGSTNDIAGTVYDWGMHNRHGWLDRLNYAGTDHEWRVLTADEWNYLFSRTKVINGASKKLYAYAIVHGRCGMLLFPDDWEGDVNGIAVNIIYDGGAYDDNIFNSSTTPTWADLQEYGKVVFLPAAGKRTSSIQNFGDRGFYWTASSSSSSTDKAKAFCINPITDAINSGIHDINRWEGFAVRLVHNQSDGSGTILPTVITNSPVTNITQHTATCGGNVAFSGTTTVTQRGVCWSLSENPTLINCIGHTVDGSGIGSFTSSITGLETFTVYHVRAYAKTMDNNVVYGQDVMFRTAAPTSYYFSVSDQTTVCFSPGNLYYDGSSWGFENTPQNGSYTLNGYTNLFPWGSTGENGTNIYTGGQPVEITALSTTDGTDWGGVVGELGGINGWRTPTHYEWNYLLKKRPTGLRYAKQVEGVYGTILLPDNYNGPEISSSSSISTSEWASYSDHGAVFLPKGGCYSPSSGSFLNDNNGFYWAASTDQTSSFHFPYYFSFRNNEIENNYGRGAAMSVRLVATLSGNVITAPTVSTGSISEITANSAICSGTVTSDGGLTVTERGVCWSSDQNPPHYNSNHVKASSGGLGNFTCNMTGLQHSTQYYVRTYATNAFGISYGEPVIIQTVGKPGVWSDEEVRNLTTNSATFGGQVYNDGGATVTRRGICWGTSEFPTIGTNNYVDALTDDPWNYHFSCDISGLTPGTTYHVRAYAFNVMLPDDPSYGADVVFSTKTDQYYVTTNPVTNITITSAICGGTVTNNSSALVTERGIIWTSWHPDYLEALEIDDVNGSSVWSIADNGTGVGSFSIQLTDLEDGGAYWVRAYAKVGDEYVYGEILEFGTEYFYFSVGNNKYVIFSPGNLQYHGTNGTWRFAPHQYDIAQVPPEEPQSYDDITWNTSGWVDLFGWGTWTGNDHNPLFAEGPYHNYPYGVEEYYTNPPHYYTWNIADFDQESLLQNTDLRDYNWRTLSAAEWDYLLNKRTTESGIRFAMATVNGVPGLILVPDDIFGNYFESLLADYSINNPDASFSDNEFSYEQWHGTGVYDSGLEGHGAVFLPAAGYRIEQPLDYDEQTQTSTLASLLYETKEVGMYWTSEAWQEVNQEEGTTSEGGRCVGIMDTALEDQYPIESWYGGSVRLVREINLAKSKHFSQQKTAKSKTTRPKAARSKNAKAKNAKSMQEKLKIQPKPLGRIKK